MTGSAHVPATSTAAGLKRVLKTRHAVITSLAVITPAGAILFLPIPIAANAGPAMPLSILFGFAVVIVIMNAVYRFSQRIAHAGSFFAFVRDGLGIHAGFYAGWLFLAFYPVLMVFNMILFGAVLEGIIISHDGPDIPWWVLMLLGFVAIWLIAILGIRLSVRSDLALLTFEGLVLLALAITVIVNAGAWEPGAFNPGNGPSGFSGVVLGAVFGVLAFTGFEAPTYLGEEIENPRRSIPKALLITVLGMGVVYLFFFYTLTVGYSNIGELPNDPAPWSSLGQRYWNSDATVLVDIATVVALIAGGLAAQNGAARMLLALGRDGLLPRPLGLTLRRFGTPHIALTFLLLVAVGLGLGVGGAYGPLPAFNLLALVVTLNALGVYALVQVALVRYFWKRGAFNPLWHLLAPAFAVAAIVYLYLKSISPAPPHPTNLAIWITLAWAVIGLVAMAALQTVRPQRFALAAEIIGEGGEADTAEPAPAASDARMSDERQEDG
jgi:amino acid transporter